MRGVTVGALVLALAAGGCKKRPDVQGPTVEEDEILVLLRTRPLPDPTQARFSIKMRSRPLKIAAPRLGGGLIVDRPDRAYLAVMDPLGSPVVTLTTDGRQVVFVNNRDKQYVVQDDPAAALGGATDGGLSMEDVVGMLLGLLPIDQAKVLSRDQAGEDRVFVFEGPGGLQIAAWVDPATATPRHVEVTDREGRRALNATYEPFVAVDGGLLPSSVDLEVPAVELFVDVDFKSWNPLDAAPDVFSPAPPARYEVIPFQSFVEKMGRSVSTDETGEEDVHEDAPAR